MKLIIKKLLLIFLVFVVIFSLAACGGEPEDLTKGSSSTVEQDHNQGNNQSSKKYANVDGYPIVKDNISLHKLFINGEEYFLDAYTHNDSPDKVYFSPTPIAYSLNGNAVGGSSNDSETWGFVFGDSLGVMTLGKTDFNVDGLLYYCAAPEQFEHEKYGKTWYNDIELFKVMLNADVHFSSNRSAVYVETNKNVNKSDTDKFELSIDGHVFIAKNNSDGYEIRMNYMGVYKNSKNQSSSSQGDKDVTSTISCGTCGGSGRIIMGSQNVWNGSFYELKTTYGSCPNCGGSGHITIHR